VANERALAGPVDNFLGAAVTVADMLSHSSTLARPPEKETPPKRGLSATSYNEVYRPRECARSVEQTRYRAEQVPDEISGPCNGIDV
jgi:hypothetical protein